MICGSCIKLMTTPRLWKHPLSRLQYSDHGAVPLLRGVNATRFDPGSPIPTCPTKFLFSLSPIESWPISCYCSMNSHSAESPFHEVICGFHPLPRETIVPDEPEKKDPQDFVGTQCPDVSFISIFLNPHRTAPHPMRYTADGKVIPRAIYPMSAHSISPVRNP